MWLFLLLLFVLLLLIVAVVLLVVVGTFLGAMLGGLTGGIVGWRKSPNGDKKLGFYRGGFWGTWLGALIALAVVLAFIAAAFR
jgi:hypothetical protein